ncbi:FAD-dependent oxidoreductase [Dermatobacter hominis]|uniref:FAD-dependent oxidoreductase n=1 Tax=Dermatobacter hominis TaxID=2884263 RepID=UPI001D0F8807|nr:FAD-dependent oxidoreductase [Dermatobacter hominis]UDY35413.1 FAD-dependent oxidoreductase [Dermatobacter hominis]
MIDVDVVVVGAGAMGSAAAWRLASEGRSVALLERFGRGHDRGSSHGSTRIFRIAYRDARYVHLAVRALPLWRRLEDAAGEVLLEQDGQLDHGHAAAIEEIAGHLEGTGHPAQVLRPDQAAERWPGMRFDEAVVYSPEGGRCYADRTVAACQRLAAAAGAEVRFDTRVERIEVGTGAASATVHTADGAWRAPVVVVAAGAWVAPLLDGVDDVRLPPVVVESDQPSHFRPVDPDTAWPSFLHHMAEESAADHPLAFHAYGLLSPGEGVKVGGYGTVVPDDAEHRGGISEERRAEQVRYVERWLPGLDPTPVSTTSCLFTTTPDEHFVLDRRGPVVVCSPCSGHGFKFVPAIADEVVSLVAGHPQRESAWRLR